MTFGNYPPGVSGNEPEISGVEGREMTEDRTCESCGEDSVVEVAAYLHRTEIIEQWTCRLCGYENERSIEREDDPDDLRDARLDEL